MIIFFQNTLLIFQVIISEHRFRLNSMVKKTLVFYDLLYQIDLFTCHIDYFTFVNDNMA